ncbi:unnamed protein product [Closterium sp. NIES-64]|nr:unnamed protein product [Closterium sp. NIES-64]
MGSMAARLVALCGMEALAVAAGFLLKVLWLTDAPVHAAPFSSLFSLPAHPKISKPDLRIRWAVEDVSPECVAGPLLRSPPHGFKYKAASVGDSHQNTPLDSCAGCPANISQIIPPFSHPPTLLLPPGAVLPSPSALPSHLACQPPFLP